MNSQYRKKILDKKKMIEKRAKDHNRTRVVGGGTLVFDYGSDVRASKKASTTIKMAYRKNELKSEI